MCAHAVELCLISYLLRLFLLEYDLSNIQFILKLVKHILLSLQLSLHVIHELLERLFHLSTLKPVLLHYLTYLLLQLPLLPLAFLLRLAYLLVQPPYLLCELLVQGVFDLRDLIRMVENQLFLLFKGLFHEIVIAFVTGVHTEFHFVVNSRMV